MEKRRRRKEERGRWGRREGGDGRERRREGEKGRRERRRTVGFLQLIELSVSLGRKERPNEVEAYHRRMDSRVVVADHASVQGR